MICEPLSTHANDDFLRIIRANSTPLGHGKILKAACWDTPLGSVVAIADDSALYLLAFMDCLGLESQIERLRQNTKSAIVPGSAPPIQGIKDELKQYFNGQLKKFKTPLLLQGSFFQKQVWTALQKIAYGETRSYASIAQAIGRPSACRAVAQANAANPFAIVIPCHRVINTNGKLGGYNGGLRRKAWLLQRESER